jgi:transposase
MGNGLKMDKKEILAGLFQLGWSSRAIHKETGIHRATIKRYRSEIQNVPKVPTDSEVEKGQSVPEAPTDISSLSCLAGEENTSLAEAVEEPILPYTNSIALRPHRSFIRDEISLGLTAQRIYQDLVERWGFSGSYDSVKRYAKKLRKRNPHWFERLPTSPGKEAQVDFGLAPCLVLKDGKYKRPYIYKMTLSHSRHAYEELVWRQDTETWIRCHEHGFRFFNGVTETVKLDNLKAGVIKPDIYDPTLNAVYAAYARHAGFVILPCQPYQPNQKGRVEHDVGYTKSNGLKGKRFESLDEGNSALRSWNKHWASTRIHGTTRMQVRRMFDETEKNALLPLPASEFPMFETGIRKVDVTGCVAIKQNFYSVPYLYICKEVLVHFNKDWVKVLDTQTHAVLIVHKTLEGKGKLSFQQGCKPPYANRPKEQQEMYYCRKAAAIGAYCERLVEHFLMTDPYRGILRVRGILRMADTIDNSVLNEACQEALRFNMQHIAQIKSLCLSILSERPKTDAPKLTQSHECIRELDEYQNHFNRMVVPV